MKFPTNTEEQIRHLAENPEFAMGTSKRGWLNWQADLAGVDRDYIYGVDDDFSAKDPEN